jgi:hypothetical protein
MVMIKINCEKHGSDQNPAYTPRGDGSIMCAKCYSERESLRQEGEAFGVEKHEQHSEANGAPILDGMVGVDPWPRPSTPAPADCDDCEENHGECALPAECPTDYSYEALGSVRLWTGEVVISGHLSLVAQERAALMNRRFAELRAKLNERDGIVPEVVHLRAALRHVSRVLLEGEGGAHEMADLAQFAFHAIDGTARAPQEDYDE